jgi:hypothetical protein
MEIPEDHVLSPRDECRYRLLCDLQSARGLHLSEIRELLELLDMRRPLIEFFGNNLGRALIRAGVVRAAGTNPRRLLTHARR